MKERSTASTCSPMDCDSVLADIGAAHEANRVVLAQARQRLERAAELLNRQIRLLGGPPAWEVFLGEVCAVDSDCAANVASIESLSSMLDAAPDRLSAAELNKYVDVLSAHLYPLQQSTCAAAVAIVKLVQGGNHVSLMTPAMRRKWSAIEASLINLIDVEMVDECRECVLAALRRIRLCKLPYCDADT